MAVLSSRSSSSSPMLYFPCQLTVLREPQLAFLLFAASSAAYATRWSAAEVMQTGRQTSFHSWCPQLGFLPLTFLYNWAHYNTNLSSIPLGFDLANSGVCSPKFNQEMEQRYSPLWDYWYEHCYSGLQHTVEYLMRNTAGHKLLLG